MGGIFKIMAFAAPVAAILLYFSLTGQEEIKIEQQIDKIDQQLEKKEFDADFDAAWNGKALPQKEAGADLKQKRAALDKRSEVLNVQSSEDMSELRSALESAGEKPNAAQ